MKAYAPPDVQPPMSALPGCGAIVAWGLLSCLSIALSIYGLIKILDTTPGMAGQLVDDQGDPIPVEGYPQFWCGLTLAIFFGFLTMVSVASLVRRRRDRGLADLCSKITQRHLSS